MKLNILGMGTWEYSSSAIRCKPPTVGQNILCASIHHGVFNCVVVRVTEELIVVQPLLK